MSLGFPRELTPIQPDIIFYLGNFGIANSTLFIIFIAILFLGIGIFLVNKFTSIPKNKFQSILEYLYEGVEDLVFQITASREHTRSILPIILTIMVSMSAWKRTVDIVSINSTPR